MLNHGRRSISVPAGGAFKGFPVQAIPEDTKFYTLQEITEMNAAKTQPVSTWPGEKESSNENTPAEPSNPGSEPTEPSNP